MSPTPAIAAPPAVCLTVRSFSDFWAIKRAEVEIKSSSRESCCFSLFLGAWLTGIVFSTDTERFFLAYDGGTKPSLSIRQGREGQALPLPEVAQVTQTIYNQTFFLV